MSAPTGLAFSHEIPKLLRLLRGESNDLDCLPTEWDWQPFARACDDHQVAAFVFCRLKGKPKTISPGLLEYLRQRFYEISARNYRLAKRLVDVTSLLQKESIPVLAYKGPTLAMAIYGDLTLRQYQDLDLMVRKEDLVNAVSVMSCCGFQIQPTFARPQIGPYLVRPQKRRDVAVAEEIPFRSPSGTYYVDLHWQLGHDYWRAFSPDVDKIWDRIERQDLPLGRISTFCREDLFLALCFHGT